MEEEIEKSLKKKKLANYKVCLKNINPLGMKPIPN